MTSPSTICYTLYSNSILIIALASDGQGINSRPEMPSKTENQAQGQAKISSPEITNGILPPEYSFLFAPLTKLISKGNQTEVRRHGLKLRKYKEGEEVKKMRVKEVMWAGYAKGGIVAGLNDPKIQQITVNIVFEGTGNPKDKHSIVGVEIRGDDDTLIKAAGEESDTELK